MKKLFIFSFVISLCLFVCGTSVQATTYASMSPVITEIVYALKAEDNLVGVSSACNYPQQATQKPIIGDTYFVNAELLIEMKPDYIFAMNSAKAQLGALSATKTKPIYFEFENIEDVYEGINTLAKLTDTDENSHKLIKKIQANIEKYKTKKPQKILYLIQANPLVTTGKGSFITDIIKKSGHISVTETIPYPYPSVSMEYAIKTAPDVIVVNTRSDATVVRRFFPHTKILYLTEQQRDIVNRSGPRVYEAVRLFAELDFLELEIY